jgi:hypothetical protein
VSANDWAVLAIMVGTALIASSVTYILVKKSARGPSDEEILYHAQRAYLMQEVQHAVEDLKIPGTVPYDVELSTPSYSLNFIAEIPGTDASVIAKVFVQQILLNDYTLSTEAWWEGELDA